MSAPRRELLLLAVGSVVLFGLRIGARDLWNPNEPIYGEAVREMAQRGEWLLPYVNGVVFAEKPILFSEKEGKIAWANRRKDPLYLFAALQRHLGYPVVPRPKRPDESVNLLPLLMQQVQRLESRVKLLEEEARGGIDITKFYNKSGAMLPNVQPPDDLLGPTT